MLIGIGHKKFSGKDTAADYLVKEHGFVKDSFAGDLKKEVCRIWRKTILAWVEDNDRAAYWNRFQEQEYRVADDPEYNHVEHFVHWLVYKAKPPFIVALLQNHGTELRRAEDPAYWTKKVVSRYICSGRPNTVVQDVRYPNEALAIRGQGGNLIRLDRTIDRAAFGTHISETALDDSQDWDYIIANEGSLKELFANLDLVITDIQEQ